MKQDRNSCIILMVILLLCIALVICIIFGEEIMPSGSQIKEDMQTAAAEYKDSLNFQDCQIQKSLTQNLPYHYNNQYNNCCKKMTLTMYSNLTDDFYITGYHKKHKFFISVDDLCKLIGGQITDRSNYTINFATHLVKDRGYRYFKIDMVSKQVSELIGESNTYDLAIPVVTINHSLYVSVVHFLQYFGANVVLNTDASVQLFVQVPYSIIDVFVNALDNKYF